jgi:hypothetical protein
MEHQVICYSSSSYARRPLAFIWKDQRKEITNVLDECRTPMGKQFTVRTGDGLVYLLLYLDESDTWRITER